MHRIFLSVCRSFLPHRYARERLLSQACLISFGFELHFGLGGRASLVDNTLIWIPSGSAGHQHRELLDIPCHVIHQP
jgi:hypothetical protein